MLTVAPAMLAALAATPASEPIASANLRSDAAAIEQIVNGNYAYLERLPNGEFVIPDKLRGERERIVTKSDLVRYGERALSLLADHHAITGSSTPQSWALVPSFADLWIEPRLGRYIVEQVRQGSPAQSAGIKPGDWLSAIDGVDTAAAVRTFWAELGTTGGGERDGYAARVLAAGKRDRARSLTIQRSGSRPRTLTLVNLYQLKRVDRPPLSVSEKGGEVTIRFNDSLGSDSTVASFDAAMGQARRGQPVVLDLTDTPGGGNTNIARAILGWFVTKPTFYQMHRLMSEERRTGIPRQWVEQVLPRPGKHHSGQVTVRVGRWTGSMGEGLAIGFAALGARVEGSRMAGLLGAIHDYKLPSSGLVLKIPAERLYSVDGRPREKFAPDDTIRRQ